MTKEMSRAKILNYLNALMDSDKADIAYAKEYIAKYSDSELGGYEYPIKNHYEPIIKYGVYHKVADLHDEIINAMGIAPIRIETITYWNSFSSHSWTSHKKVIKHIPIYSDEAEATIKTVISRMAEQGYIKISKSGQGFKVLKTK